MGMRRILLLSLLAACAPQPAAPPPAAPTPAPAPAAAPAPAPAAAPALDDAAAIARAHAFFDAFDHRDADAMRPLVTSGWVLYQDGSARDLATISKRWQPGRPPVTRDCKDETVHSGDGAVVYTSECTEHVPSADGGKPSDWTGWNAVVMVPVDGTWKVALWQWQLGGIAAKRQTWNSAFRHGNMFTKKPTQLLVDSVKGVKPGAALVLAMGQGRNALYLASQGWKVTGVDISDVGLAKARKQAAARKLNLNAVNADIDKYDFGTNRWELATMLYAGTSKDWLARLKKAIKPGGMIVVEFFSQDPKDPNSGGFAPGALAKQFSDWKIIRDEVVHGVADWGKKKVPLVHFVARKP